MTRAAPYGTWDSPISPEQLVEAVVRLSNLQVYGDDVCWVESRPAEGGREVIVRQSPGEPATDALPPGFSARTSVHEYGGRCYAVHGPTIVFSNWEDQRLWVREGQSAPSPLTGEPERPRSVRYADPVFAPGGREVICVRERHLGGGDVVNDLVRFALGSDGEALVLAEGHDFYAAPRVSPDGSRLAWLTWDLPDMPWDSSTLWMADLSAACEVSGAVAVADGSSESVTQPRWSPSGVLHYVSDRTGWWNLYEETGTPLCPMEAEFGAPDWVFGASTYLPSGDGTAVAAWHADGAQHLGRVAGGRASEWSLPYSAYASLSNTPAGLVAIAASPTEPPAVIRIDSPPPAAAGAPPGREPEVTVLRRSQEGPPDPAGISVPSPVRYPTGDGETSHALLYLPVNTAFRPPEGEKPPVVVTIHGGPTSSASPVFNRNVQFWTSRGFAVVDVDYRGSAGYGRRYRDRLKGSWGLTDVDDCASAVRWLSEQGIVDGARAVIRGGSAGGFTALAALAFTDVFAAGASLYGVGDLELLARDTHKFESRYLDSLVGPWPQDAEEYRRRSPIHHVDLIGKPLILFQGLEDRVVPPEQAETMFEALRSKGIPVELVTFEGEQHGFRRAETIVAVAKAELAFYQRVLGISPPA